MGHEINIEASNARSFFMLYDSAECECSTSFLNSDFIGDLHFSKNAIYTFRITHRIYLTYLNLGANLMAYILNIGMERAILEFRACPVYKSKLLAIMASAGMYNCILVNNILIHHIFMMVVF